MHVEWQTGVVVPIFKKEDRKVCSLDRGITLHGLPGKIYSSVLERRLQPIAEPLNQEEQYEFCPDYGTADQFYTFIEVLRGS